VTDRLAIPGDDDVALVHAGLGSWSLRLDFHHHHASSAILDGDKLEAEAQITPRDVSVFLKPRCDTLNGSRRNYEDATARSEHRHANRSARRLNGKTAFRTPPHAQIKFDPSVDLTATQGPPRAGAAGNYAKCRDWRTVFSTHCYSECTDRYRWRL
jgi:hypothetical protein